MASTLYRNPEYDLHYAEWTLARDLYEANHSVLTQSGYLWPHAIEEAKDAVAARIRARRAQRTRYLNLCEIIISLWTSLFFKSEPRLDAATKKLLEDHGGERNIDGKGTSFINFLQNKVLKDYLLYGKVIIIADSLPIVARNITEAQEKGLRPFLSTVDPLDFVDWSRETSDPKKLMSFQMARYQFTGVMPRQSSADEPKIRRFSYEYRLNNNTVTLHPSYVDLDGSYNVIADHWDKENQSEVWQETLEPIVLDKLENIPIAVIESESWLDDANQEILRHFNLRSNRDNINYNQGFDEKYLKLQGGKVDEKRLSAFNEYTHKIISTDEDAFKIPPIDPIAYERAEAEAIRNIFRVGLNRLHSLPDGSNESPSAESQDKNNEYTAKLVESSIAEIEDIANEALKHYAAFKGDTNFSGKVELDKEVSEQSFEQFVTIWQAFSDELSKVQEIKAEVSKKALAKLRLPKNKMAKLEALLDKQIEADGEAQNGQTQEIDPIDAVLNGRRNTEAPNNPAV